MKSRMRHRLYRGFIAFTIGLSTLSSGSSTGNATIDKMFIVQLTHLDIGFTNPPDDVAEECKARIDQVLGYLDIYPQFKWTIESVWQLEQWLLRTVDPYEIERLFDHVREGRISIGGGYANMHSSMLGNEEMNRLFYPANRFRENFGVEIATMLMNDVPGWSWSIPQAACRSDIRYFLTGANTWLGGAAEIPMADRAFIYEGPDGSRILAWMGYGAYLEGSFDYSLHSGYSQMETEVLSRIEEWEAAGYPYDAILILDGTGDNGMANRAIEIFDNVDWWNANHDSRMILATPEEFFRHMEMTYGGTFPIYSGDSAGLWAGAGNCATPVSQSWIRISGDRALTAEKLFSINYLNGAVYPVDRLDSLYQNIRTFDEHSGASVGWPGMMTVEEVDRQNAYHFETALRAYSAGETLLATGLGEFASVVEYDRPGILVFNPLSWERSDIVTAALPTIVLERNFVLRDGVTNEEVPYERSDDRSIDFVAESVPSVGYRAYYLEEVPEPPVYPDRVISSGNGRVLENDFYRVSVGADGVRILDKTHGRELVNQESDFSFNGLIRAVNLEDFWGVYHDVPFGPATVSGSSGPVRGETVIHLETSPIVRFELTLTSDVKRIDLVSTLDRSRMQFVPYDKHSEHYSLTFPFDLDVTGDFRAHIENPNLMIRPDRDYLPGALVANFVSQHAISLREESGFGVILANRESFFNEIGGVSHRQTAFQPDEATIVNKVVQKIDQGDTSDQGIVTITSLDNGIEISAFHYALTSGSITPGSRTGKDPLETVRFGWSFDHPLEAVFTRGAPGNSGRSASPSESFFHLSHDNAIIGTIKKSGFGDESDIIFRIQEIEGEEVIGVELHSSIPFTYAELNTIVEEGIPGGELPVDPITFDLGPYQTRTIRARR